MTIADVAKALQEDRTKRFRRPTTISGWWPDISIGVQQSCGLLHLSVYRNSECRCFMNAYLEDMAADDWEEVQDMSPPSVVQEKEN
jgi:hypothetical protein